ncbi:Astacin domain containing protein [Asbolus verrucosus]|uniref:Metalloendopeptidase n=1 Tax=Asbolus verrucosus TaxID=1661398 RepID=A0A482V7F3_ASBVE|nr:Astacin domain containing protein [Asbolus verrucosus]
MWRIFVILLLSVLEEKNARYILPIIPDVIHPPVLDDVKIYADMEFMFEDTDPEVTPGLFQGDMAMTDEIYNYWRVGIRWEVFPEKLWINGTVPYVISPIYESADQVTILKAIHILNFMTRIRFVPWNSKTKDYIWSGPSNTLKVVDSTEPNCLGKEGHAIHELMHTLGIFREQSRWDRDKFVKVHLDNIIPQFVSNFDKQSLENTTYSFEYDYDSIMHYGKNFFNKGKGKPTITPKMPGVKRLG